MQLLALAQSSPGLFYGICIYLLIIFFFVKKHLIKKDVLFNYCSAIFLIFAAFIGQSLFRNHQAIIEAMVSDGDLRLALTKGTYSMENGINALSAFRLFFYATITTFYYMIFDRTRDFKVYLSYFVSFSLASFIICYLFVNLYGSRKMKSFLSNFSSLWSENYLTQDDFGYRISGFFNEPSHSSIVIGTALAGIFVLKRNVILKMATVLGVLIVFTLSRSLSVFLAYCSAILFLYANKSLAILATIALALVQGAILLLADYYGRSGVFRSVYERTFRSDVFNADTLDIIYGYDFGQVYSFEPFYGIILQLGILGLIALFFLVQRDVRAFGFACITFSMVPQMWYYPSWTAIGLFVVTRKNMLNK